MDVEGASTLSGNGAQSVESRSRPVQRHLDDAVYQFTQQNLPACKPVLTPAWVISMFFLIGVVFIPIGLLCLYASESVIEIVDRYDTDCVPDNFKSQKVAYIKDSSVSKNCTRYLKVSYSMGHIHRSLPFTSQMNTKDSHGYFFKAIVNGTRVGTH